ETENISYACLDVFDTEPPLQEDELFKYKNTILTPHIGYFTKEAMLKRASIVFTNLYSFLDGKLINSVY
ncbi:MAG: NAD(P)-dependent oxidoreductase, partial [bacterium]|nr:NAD(P)-dependent oxidoreductase [bacterium]